MQDEISNTVRSTNTRMIALTPRAKRGHKYSRFEIMVRAVWLAFVVAIAALDCRYPFSGAKAGADDQSALAKSGLVRNGSFESGLSQWWGPGLALMLDSSAKGKSVLRLEGGYAVQEHIPVAGGNRYRLTLMIRSDGASAESVFVQISYRGVDPGWYGPVDIVVADHREPAIFVTGGTHRWRPFSAVVEAPKNSHELLLYLRKREQSPGAAFFDAVTLIKTDAPASSAPNVKREALAANVFPRAIDRASVDFALKRLVETGQERTPSWQALARNGQALMHIHVSAEADLMTLGAAKDLAEYLGRIAGADFLPLSDDAKPGTGPMLVVGRTSELARKLISNEEYQNLGDGFLIRSVGQHIVIAGATSRGTMYGVNWFLDRKLGVRWLAPKVTTVPNTAMLQLARLEERQVPRFSYREVLSYESQDKDWRAHNLLNGESHGPSFSPSPPEIDSWDHSWMAKDGSATFMELLQPNRFQKSHPDWFAGGQVAMMNPEVRAIMAGAIIERLRQHPDYKNIWFTILDMDRGWDMDPASREFADRHGGHPSAPRLDMMIDIANRVRTVMPGARLAFNAYHWSFIPPPDMKVPEYLLVFPMTIQVDYSYPLYEGANQALGQGLAGWNAQADHVFVWDHITNFSGFIQPTPNIYPIGQSIKWLATLAHVEGYFAEGSWNTPGAEFASLRAWLIARLLWNPQESLTALLSDYCQNYYGAAAEFVERYIDLEHAAITRNHDMLGEKTQVDLKMFDFDFIRGADALFDAAQAAVIGTPFEPRVLHARMPLDYVILLRRREDEEDARRSGTRWQLNAAGRLARLRATLTAEHVQQYRQGGDVAELLELLKIERRLPSTPPPLLDLPVSDWVDFQDLSFNRYGDTRIVADQIASDGAAARMSAQTSAWNIQFKLDRLPKDGDWWLYVSLRIEGKDERTDVPAVVHRFLSTDVLLCICAGKRANGWTLSPRRSSRWPL